MSYWPSHRKASPFDVEDAKRILLEAKNILDGLGVEFFLVYGTALGAYRDMQLIPWDYDIDLGIIGTEIEKVREALLKEGFSIKKWGKHDYHYIPATKNKILLDIHFYREEADRLVVYSHHKEAWMWHPKKFKTLEEVEMYGEKWLVPSPIEEYLSWTYGDWKQPSEKSATEK